MEDELDKMLEAYKVKDADEALLNRIVAAAENQRRAANRNRRRLLQRVAMLSLMAVFGFWLGNTTRPAASVTNVPATAAAPEKTAAATQQDYLDRIILGPRSLDDVGL